MEIKTLATYQVKIYLAGDVDIIKNECRKYCLEIGLCVTVTPTLFIYSGGEEYGVEIGLINYPRFPDTASNIDEKAISLAERCRKAASQWSYLIITPVITIYDSKRANK